jgi:hypothetical protein
VVGFGRAETYFDLTDASDLSLGVSGALGKNKPDSTDLTYLLGTDLLVRWKPGGQSWPYVRWLTEAIWAFRERPIVTAGSHKGEQARNDVVGGFFSEIGYRFLRHWQLTGRVDFVGIPKGNEDEHLRLTGGLRFLISSVAKLGVQYGYSFKSGQDPGYSAIYFQLNIGIGTVTPGVGRFIDPF